jgi:hypothetical protein
MFAWVVHYALGNIPVWVWPALGGGAAAVYFLSGILSHLPQFKIYAFLIKPVAWIAMMIGVFMYGGSGVVAIYQADLKEAEHVAQIAAEQSKSANLQLQSVLKTNANLIKGHAYGNRQAIESHRAVINQDCKVSDTAIEDYNRAVKNTATYNNGAKK